jgi:hypothetical protein
MHYLNKIGVIAGAKETSKAEAESVEGGGPQVTEQDIANIVAQWTGIPIEKVSADETERLIKMEEVLHGRVIGQVRGWAGGGGRVSFVGLVWSVGSGVCAECRSCHHQGVALFACLLCSLLCSDGGGALWAR